MRFILMLLLFPSWIHAQDRLFLKKGGHTIKLKPRSTIGVTTQQDTIKYGTDLWKIDSILPQHLAIKRPATYEYRTVSTAECAELLQKDWHVDSVLHQGTAASRYRVKRPVTYQSQQLPYTNITTISYAKSENTSGCIGCVIFPVMVIAAPFAGWSNGKFNPGAFVPLFTIGAGGTLLVYSSFKKREVRNYRIGEWSFVVK